MSEIVLPILDGHITHPLAADGQQLQGGWVQFVYRAGQRVRPVPNAFLEKLADGLQIEARGIVRGGYLRSSAEIRSSTEKVWIRHEGLFRVCAIDDQSLTLEQIEESEIPHLYDCDPTAHPGLRWLLAELANARRHIEQLEHLTAEVLEREARRSQ